MNRRWAQRWKLHAAGAQSCLLYGHLTGFEAINGVPAVTHFLVVMAALFALYAGAGHLWAGSWKIVLGWAILFRLLLLPAGLPPSATWPDKLRMLGEDLRGDRVVFERFVLYDNDLWRYLWDGHIAAQGRNPYLEAPADHDPSEAVWRDVRDNVSYAHIRTLYPPLAEFVFRLSHWLAPASVLTLKLLIVFFDLAGGAVLALTLKALGRNPGESLLYLWNPVVVKVFAGSAHIDSLVVLALSLLGFFLVQGLHRWAGVAFGLAVLAKLSPLVLIGVLAKRVSRSGLAVGLAVVLLGYLPYLRGGLTIFDGARTFSGFWEFNAGVLYSIRWMAPGLNARWVCLGLLGLVLWWIWRRKGEFFASAADSLGWVVVLSPAVMPWYTTWAMPLAILGRRPQWLFFSGLSLASFGVMVDGQERSWMLAAEYALFFVTVWHYRMDGRSSPDHRVTSPTLPADSG